MPTEQDGFRILDHTADVGLEARAADLASLFSNAARGMFSIIASLDNAQPSVQILLGVTADNLEDLLVNWLSELLYLFSTEKVLFSRFEITEIDDHHIRAKALGQPIDQSSHDLYTEIKAVTYHQLKVTESNRMWTARVFFDV